MPHIHFSEENPLLLYCEISKLHESADSSAVHIDKNIWDFQQTAFQTRFRTARCSYRAVSKKRVHIPAVAIAVTNI